MNTTIQSVGRFFKSEDGPTSVEYCFMIGFILLVCIAAIGAVGDATLIRYQEAEAEITK
ncbi:MAG: Flp family type IVb pilin [Planctomycetota bacterium]|nr:Flp family type IVb pilin [Planctomycetota bacterium]MDA1249027.1 Flp family type IVb pilin [Planctomycetota bacterium]